MALIQCDFASESLGMACSMNVILPQATPSQVGLKGVSRGQEPPVLYLLHGYSDDHTIWTRRTSIERYVAELGLAVVMPNVHTSFYADMVQGGKYWEFISQELPEVCRSFFRLSDRREDTFVAGLSMGGYGAFKLALNYPERFAAAASLSGALLVDRLWERRDAEESGIFFEPMFGSPEQFLGSENDLAGLVRQAGKNGVDLPALFHCCGTEDFLIEENRAFDRLLDEQGFAHTYEEHPGDHNWGFWDEHIQRVLAWLPIHRRD